jgi:mono/diheme cytochrome c family protein
MDVEARTVMRPGSMVRWLVVLVGVLTVVGRPDAVRAQEAEPAVGMTAASTREVLDEYCVRCHNDRTRVAGLALDTTDLSHVSTEAETWERVIVKLRAQTMPPAGGPRPDQATYRATASWLETEIDAVALDNADPGRGETFHRLNRAEYQAAVRDLLAVDVDVAALLPADNTYEHGFDNNGEMLSISPDLVSRYLSAARKISRLAVGIPPVGPAVATYRVHPALVQDDRQDDALSFGSRGGVAVSHYFPVDGEYTIQIRLHRNFSDYIIGFSSPQELDVRIDGEFVTRFSVGDADAVGKMAPLSFSGNIAGDPEWEYYMNTGDAGLDVRFPAKAGQRTVGVSFVRRLFEADGVLQPRNRGYGRFVDERYDENPGVEQVAIGGPYTVEGPGDTPSRREVFVCQPDVAADEAACASRILSRLARRAYRRPVLDAEVATLMEFYASGRRDGNFDAGIQFALERMLVDPEFLFRIERDPPGLAPNTPYRLSDLELASRLSFFLWSSLPDDELLAIAERGQLTDPAVLEQQTRRLLADRRSRALIDNFVSQWLRLRNLESQQRESADYPEFDENLREAFRRETELFVESTIRDDRSVLELLSANYTFLNERLARHYGIPGIYGDRFRRVTLDENHPRGGLLGQGGLLMVTSHPNRTSPVLRGKWLLESMLGAPPPEPPPNVPGLPERGDGGVPASVRDRLEQHRANPVCASCHAPMDPLGFALENFDAIGSWRATSEAGLPIDSSGTMPSGTQFEGPAGLRSVLLSRDEEFAGALTEKLLAYAVGRGLEYSDQPSVRQMLRDAAPDTYRWSSLILGIVKSAPFQGRRSRGDGAVRVASRAPTAR